MDSRNRYTGLVDKLFRHEYSNIVAALVSRFGPDRLQLAEDVTSEALLKALKIWPYQGQPENPSAWLHVTARNLALDSLRREKNFESKSDSLAHEISAALDNSAKQSADNPFGDELLYMIFVCCDPALPSHSHSPLILKTLCGLSVDEIARALLIDSNAVSQRLSRARKHLRENPPDFDLSDRCLRERLPSALESLYLLFSEGYNTHLGDTAIREELCVEAIRLTRILNVQGAINTGEIDALLSLMYFQISRLPARLDIDGTPITLADQDRNLWDKELINRGFTHLERSMQGESLSAYHLQAAIASCHARAASFAETDWRSIIDLYDQLMRLDSTPIVALNRIVALSYAESPTNALLELSLMQSSQSAPNTHYIHAVRADLLERVGDYAGAISAYDSAIAACPQEPERLLLAHKRAQLAPRN